MSKKFSKEKEKFGTGHVEGLVEAGASNNASLASGWVPALLFGIPGDTITAIAIGVLYMKGLNPGRRCSPRRRRACTRSTSFRDRKHYYDSLGIMMILRRDFVLRAPRASIMPVIILCAAVGAFATGNNLFARGPGGHLRRHRLRDGSQRLSRSPPWCRHRHGHDGGASFVTSLIKSDGSLLPFFERPVSAVLAALTIGALLWPVVIWLKKKFAPRSDRKLSA